MAHIISLEENNEFELENSKALTVVVYESI